MDLDLEWIWIGGMGSEFGLEVWGGEVEGEGEGKVWIAYCTVYKGGGGEIMTWTRFSTKRKHSHTTNERKDRLSVQRNLSRSY